MPEYTEQDLQNAIVDVRNGVAVRTAATRHGVPRGTLRARLNGAQPQRTAHGDQQRLTVNQEEHLKQWILRQEALGYAPTHAQVRAIASSVLKQQGDHKPLGRKWSSHFVERHLAVKTKLGRRTDWKRINAATPDNIKHLFNLYETVSWIPPRRRYNADEGGIMEGQGINGLVIGSSQENPNTVPVKTINARTWTSIVECISTLGVALNLLVIFKAKSIQEQWFKKDFLAKHPGWHVTFSENGWTSNDIAVEWLGKVFLPQTQPEDPADGRLLIVDGHGSHTSDEFMTMCYLNNVGKANFLEFYAKAREIGLRKKNVQSGWKATGLYPKNVAKPLNSRWVVVAKRPAIPLRATSDISTPKRGGDVVKLFAEKSGSPTSRLSIRKAAAALDKVAMEVILRDREIEGLRVQLAQAKPAKRRKIVQDPNERFASLAQANREPQQRVQKARNAVQEVIIVEGESSSESEEEPALARRSARNRRLTKCYMERYSNADEESA
ncbi:hypothetical protein FocnCong_v013212 [Fusarium oxysporum f. sp. conglutinans]|nr:hypothetical protein FocnCong_v013212 [Fusarium oxysporum f. sp. conglutinans]